MKKLQDNSLGKFFLILSKKKIVEFGWILNQNSWGKGYMPEAARCLFELCFNELGIEVIQAEHLTENSKSGRVMEKLGMKHLGKVYSYFPKFKQPILTDYWAITKNEYTLLH
ncbi:GNAT family N-acetyltransferase [Lactococcus cremoris]